MSPSAIPQTLPAPLTSAPSAVRRLRQKSRDATRAYLSPPPHLTVSQWADTYRVLSREYAAEPGRWRTDRAPFQREIMDAFSDPEIETVVGMLASQTGKTEALKNVIGYFMHQDPSPMLMIRPSLGEAEQWSKTRLAPMIRDTSVLTGRVTDPKSRDSGNTLLIKEFPGGHITLVGANAPSGLAAKPIRIVLGDEVDRFPASAGTEGDPITLGERRASNFWNRKKGYFSTPSLEHLSRITALFQTGDRRYYLVPCPACQMFQRLTWANLRWDTDQPETAAYLCAGCGVLIPEREKEGMNAKGKWERTAPTSRTASFHLNALYSPWARWPELAEFWLKAQGDLLLLQVFVNTILAEVWKERGGMETATLEDRREAYQGVPTGVAVLTMGVDVQADRLEYVVRGWGVAEESWYQQSGKLIGDPAVLPGQPGSPWDALDRLRAKPWVTPSGQAITIAATGVDSGYLTDAVYAYCKPRFAQRVYAVKGSSTANRPLLPNKPSVTNRARVRLFELGTESGKDVIYARLRIAVPGPQYMHLPEVVPAEYLEQLTAESAVKKLVNGRWTRRYVLPRGKRSEALDCEVYALAVFRLLGLSSAALAELAAKYAAPVDPVEAVKESTPVTPLPRPRANWVDQWRR